MDRGYQLTGDTADCILAGSDAALISIADAGQLPIELTLPGHA